MVSKLELLESTQYQTSIQHTHIDVYQDTNINGVTGEHSQNLYLEEGSSVPSKGSTPKSLDEELVAGVKLELFLSIKQLTSTFGLILLASYQRV